MFEGNIGFVSYENIRKQNLTIFTALHKQGTVRLQFRLAVHYFKP